MKFYSIMISIVAIVTALFAAGLMLYQEQYFRGYLLALFIVMQCDVLAVRMKMES